MARGLTSVEMTSTTGLRARLSPGRRRRLPCRARSARTWASSTLRRR